MKSPCGTVIDAVPSAPTCKSANNCCVIYSHDNLNSRSIAVTIVAVVVIDVAVGTLGQFSLESAHPVAEAVVQCEETEI